MRFLDEFGDMEDDAEEEEEEEGMEGVRARLERVLQSGSTDA